MFERRGSDGRDETTRVRWLPERSFSGVGLQPARKGQRLAVSAEDSGWRCLRRSAVKGLLSTSLVPIARAPSLTALENLDHHNGYLLNYILNYSGVVV